MEDLKIEGWPHVFASLDILHRFERESDLAKIAQVSKLCRDAVNEYRKKWKATLKSRFPELARFPSMLTAYARLHRYCQGVANLLSGNVQSTIVETPVAPLTVLHFAPLLNRGSLESPIRLDTFQLRRPKQFWKLESSEIREIPRDGVASLFTLQILQTELIEETSWLVPKEGSGPFTIEIGESEAAVWSKDGEVLQHDLVGGPYLESGAFLRFVRDNDYIFQITIDRDDYYDPETKEIGDVGSLIVAGVILREKGGDRSLVVLVCQDGEVHLRDGEAKRHLLTLTLPTPIINTTPSLDYRVFNRSIVSTFDRNTDKIHVKFKEDISGLFCLTTFDQRDYLDRWLVVTANGILSIWDPTTNTVVQKGRVPVQFADFQLMDFNDRLCLISLHNGTSSLWMVNCHPNEPLPGIDSEGFSPPASTARPRAPVPGAAGGVRPARAAALVPPVVARAPRAAPHRPPHLARPSGQEQTLHLAVFLCLGGAYLSAMYIGFRISQAIFGEIPTWWNPKPTMAV